MPFLPNNNHTAKKNDRLPASEEKRNMMMRRIRMQTQGLGYDEDVMNTDRNKRSQTV